MRRRPVTSDRPSLLDRVRKRLRAGEILAPALRSVRVRRPPSLPPLPLPLPLPLPMPRPRRPVRSFGGPSSPPLPPGREAARATEGMEGPPPPPPAGGGTAAHRPAAARGEGRALWTRPVPARRPAASGSSRRSAAPGLAAIILIVWRDVCNMPIRMLVGKGYFPIV